VLFFLTFVFVSYFIVVETLKYLSVLQVFVAVFLFSKMSLEKHQEATKERVAMEWSVRRVEK
jgi:hypothetical protein